MNSFAAYLDNKWIARKCIWTYDVDNSVIIYVRRHGREVET